MVIHIFHIFFVFLFSRKQEIKQHLASLIQQSWLLPEIPKNILGWGVHPGHSILSNRKVIPHQSRLSPHLLLQSKKYSYSPQSLWLIAQHNYIYSDNFPENSGSHPSDRLGKRFALKHTMLSTAAMLCQWWDSIGATILWGTVEQ